MRWVLGVAILVATITPCWGDPGPEAHLVEGEARVGYGGGITLQTIGAVAINEEPALSAFGGLVVDFRDGKTAVGATGGVRVNPNHGPFRFGAGGTYLHSPETMWGATASAGACKAMFAPLRICGDVQLTTYFAGSALMGAGEPTSITQIQAVLGVAFDAL